MDKKKLRIGRIITQGQLSKKRSDRLEYCYEATLSACQGLAGHLSVIQTPGGFLRDYQDLSSYISGPSSNYEHFSKITENAEKLVSQLMDHHSLKSVLKDKTDFLTLGLDVFDINDSGRQAELVGTYDTKEEKVRCWTGKSYPTARQVDTLIYCTKLETHFQVIDGLSFMVLGCHDLNLFSPRSRASVSKGSFKERAISEMQALSDRVKPLVVLQHPHTTDSPRIWRAGWSGVNRWVPSASVYSSGIHYANRDGLSPRQSLPSVLRATAVGPVENFVVPDLNTEA